MGRTRWTDCFVGHYHFQGCELEGTSGRVVRQAPSPSPVDRWHDREGYTGARRALELVALEPRSASETSFTAELPTDD